MKASEHRGRPHCDLCWYNDGQGTRAAERVKSSNASYQRTEMRAHERVFVSTRAGRRTVAFKLVQVEAQPLLGQKAGGGTGARLKLGSIEYFAWDSFAPHAVHIASIASGHDGTVLSHGQQKLHACCSRMHQVLVHRGLNWSHAHCVLQSYSPFKPDVGLVEGFADVVASAKAPGLWV